ncbi:MAG: CoA-binding protein [Dehalococcoidales bacterium]|nr:MAG: CoA-binding protein [Dehalococcoidales bacterium]
MGIDLEEQIFEDSKVIAVVGLSANPERPSHRVANYLKGNGYTIIPVNPSIESTLDERSYPDLSSIPVAVDVVDIFRKSEDVLPIVEEAVKIGAKTVWLQEGVINEEAAEYARKAGLRVVMDRCMLKEHQRVYNSEY